MASTHTWTVEISITEHEAEGRTHAEATLRSVRPLLRGAGDARRRQFDQEAPEIGDELATARALADLARQVLEVATCDIDQFTRRPTRMLS